MGDALAALCKPACRFQQSVAGFFLRLFIKGFPYRYRLSQIVLPQVGVRRPAGLQPRVFVLSRCGFHILVPVDHTDLRVCRKIRLRFFFGAVRPDTGFCIGKKHGFRAFSGGRSPRSCPGFLRRSLRPAAVCTSLRFFHGYHPVLV